MNSHTRRILLPGPIGAIEVLEDVQEVATPAGVAIIAHPHPLFGGTAQNKVVQTLARAFVQCGWRTLRPNFRGVGATQGTHDGGRGELQDLLAILHHVHQSHPGMPTALAGFSFGAYVISHVLAAMNESETPLKVVMVGTAVSRFQVTPIPADLHQRTLVLHGERDDVVPLSDILDWARPQSLPVTVVPGGEHFFHGQLPLLRSLVARHLYAPIVTSH